MLAEPQRLPRLRRWGRGLVALALLALVGAVAAFQSAVHWIVERELTSALDARVRIDRLRVSPFSGGLHATELAILEKQSNQPLLRIQGLDVEVRLLNLWRRELRVTRLSLDKPEAWLALTPDGLRWLTVAASPSKAPPRLAVTLEEVTVRDGRIHVADRRSTPERREVLEGVQVDLRGLSTREDSREAREALGLTGRWRGMTVSAEGWVSPFAGRPAFHLPMRITDADLGQVAGILPAGLAPRELAGDADVAVDVSGQEIGGEWQVQAGVKIEARRVAAKPRPDLAVRGRSLLITGQGQWTPREIGFSQLRVDVAGATVDMGGRLEASVERLAARGRADLDHRGLLVPEVTVEATGLDLTDRASRPERSLAIRNASLRLGGATSDPAQPITFELIANTSVAPTVALKGTWVRAPMRLRAKADIGDLDLPGLRAWLPAGFPVVVSSGQANLGVQAEVQEGQDGAAGTRLLSVQGIAAIRNLQAGAPGYGVNSLRAAEAQADVSRLAVSLGPAGGLVEMAGRVSLRQGEGATSGLPVRTWRVAGVRADIGQLRASPFQLHLGGVEVDRPEVEVVRSDGGASGAASGPRGSPLPPVRLDRLVVRDGRVGFRDETVRPAWTGGLSQVEATVEGLRTDTDAPASFRFSAKEAEGAQVRLHGRVRPTTWSGEVHAEAENLDVLRPGPYLPEGVYRVVRGGTMSGALDLTLSRNGQGLQVAGRGDVTFAPLELGDARRELTLLLADKVQTRVEHLGLDPPAVRLGSVRIEQPWIAVGRDEDGAQPALRLINELRRSGGNGAGAAGPAPTVSIGALTISDGTAEIEDRVVKPRFRDQVRNLEVTVGGLTTEEARKASVSLKGELSDRSTVALKGFILPLPRNLYVDMDGEIQDFNLYRLNPYTARLTSYRLEQGKLYSRIHYRIEQDRLEAENLLRIDQLAVGERVEPVDRFEALVGIPLTLAVSLLQDSSGEIVLRVPVRGDLSRPEFDFAEAIGAAIRNAVVQVITAPFRLIGQIFTLGGRIGAIEIDPVLFAPGSWALDDKARGHLANVAAVVRERPSMKIKLSGMAHVESDEDGLRSQKVERELERVAREPGVKGRQDAVDRLFLRVFGASVGNITPQDKYARLKAAQKVALRDVEDLPDARILSIYDHLAGVERIDRDRIFLAEGKVYGSAEGGGDWARRGEITVLQP